MNVATRYRYQVYHSWAVPGNRIIRLTIWSVAVPGYCTRVPGVFYTRSIKCINPKHMRRSDADTGRRQKWTTCPSPRDARVSTRVCAHTYHGTYIHTWPSTRVPSGARVHTVVLYCIQGSLRVSGIRIRVLDNELRRVLKYKNGLRCRRGATIARESPFLSFHHTGRIISALWVVK